MVAEAELAVAPTSPERGPRLRRSQWRADARFPQERAQRRHVLLFFFFRVFSPPTHPLLRVSRQKHATASHVRV